jgi:epsin
VTFLNSSNNPFAVTTSPSSPASSPQQPVQSSLSNFSLPSTYESHEPPPPRDYATTPQPQPRPALAPSPQPTPKRSQTRADEEHAHLASLFAAREGDGIDTFGNVGALRYVLRFLQTSYMLMQFFSRSFGQTEYGKLAAQKTGAVPQNSFNPFAQQQQQQQQQPRQTQNNEQPFFTI